MDQLYVAYKQLFIDIPDCLNSISTQMHHQLLEEGCKNG